MIAGKPICSMASRQPSTVVARADRGVRMPAASTTSFIRPLSRNGTVCSTVRPGAPIASRNRAATNTVGSHSVSTRSTLRPRTAPSTVLTTASSSAHDAICT